MRQPGDWKFMQLVWLFVSCSSALFQQNIINNLLFSRDYGIFLAITNADRDKKLLIWYTTFKVYTQAKWETCEIFDENKYFSNPSAIRILRWLNIFNENLHGNTKTFCRYLPSWAISSHQLPAYISKCGAGETVVFITR